MEIKITRKRIEALIVFIVFIFTILPISIFAEKSEIISSLTDNTNEQYEQESKIEDNQEDIISGPEYSDEETEDIDIQNDTVDTSEDDTVPSETADETDTDKVSDLDPSDDEKKVEDLKENSTNGTKGTSGEVFDLKVNGSTECSIDIIMDPFNITIDVPLIDDPTNLYVTLYSDSSAVRFDFYHAEMNLNMVGSDGDEFNLIWFFYDDYSPIETEDGYLHLSLPGYISTNASAGFITGQEVKIRATAGFNYTEGTPIDVGYVVGDYSFSSQVVTLSYSGTYVPVEGFSFKDDVIVVGIDEYDVIPEVVVTPANATNRNCIWSSSNEAVFIVDEHGNIFPRGEGTATLTAVTLDGGLTDTCEVRVVIPVTSITIDKESVSMLSGDSITLNATVLPENASDKTVIWSISNESVATVDSSGNVTAVAEGEAVITATSESGSLSAGCSITVTRYVPIESISLSADRISIPRWETYLLGVEILPDNATNKTLIWESSDPSIAVVNDGKITALSAGTSTISVSSYDGSITMECEVVVENEESNISWEITDGVLTLYGTGPMDDYASASDSPWYSRRSEVTKVIVNDGITHIGARSFFNFTSTTEFVIGNNVKTIGVRSFQSCTGIEEIVLPESLIEISNNAFYGCTCELSFSGNAPIIEESSIPAGITINYYEDKEGFDGEAFSIYSKNKMHYGEWIVDIEPTCTEEGRESCYCSYCEDSFSRVLNALGHDYIEGICSRCGDIEIIKQGKCGSNINYILYGSGRLELSGSGSMTSYSYISSIPWYNYRDYIKEVDISLGITSISEYAFYSCTLLESISIPNSVTSIGEYCFAGCSSLSSLEISDCGISIIPSHAFHSCRELEHVILPPTITKIDKNAFGPCTGLKTINIPSTVETISGQSYTESPFYVASSSTIIYCERTTPADGWGDFWNYYYSEKQLQTYYGVSYDEYIYWNQLDKTQNTIIIPEYISCIPENAFYGCDNIQNIIIPESVKSIGDCAFYNCNSLTSIVIPESVTRIGQKSFYNCQKLINIILPESITRIEAYTFYKCSNLTALSIPDSIVFIGKEAFYYCNGLKDLYIPSSVIEIEGDWLTNPFDGCSSEMILYCEMQEKPNGWGDYWNYYDSINKLTTYFGISKEERDYWNTLDKTQEIIVLPDYITLIPPYAFKDCKSIISIQISESIISIGKKAFSHCQNLRWLFIPSNVLFIAGTSKNTSAFIGNSSQLTIFCEALEKQEGWDNYWNYYGNGNDYSLTVYYGISKDEGTYWTYLDKEQDNIILPDYVTIIPPYAFYSSSNLNSISIPEGVNSIGKYAFYDCDALTSIIFQKGVNGIGEFAFYGCDALTSVVLPNSINSIEDHSFAWCSNLESIYMPLSVTRIKGRPFDRSYSRLIIYCESDKQLGGWDYYWNYQNDYESKVYSTFFGITNDEYDFWVNLDKTKDTIVLPDYITVIPSYAFYNQYNLQSLNILGNVNQIGEFAFCQCSKLQYFSIPESVDSIKEYAFFACTSLQEIFIPSSIKTIDDWAFNALYSLQDVYYGGTQDDKNDILFLGDGYDYLLNATWHYNYLGTPFVSLKLYTDTSIQLEWREITGATAYDVYRKLNDGDWVKIKRTSSLSYDTSLFGGTNYYKVQASKSNTSRVSAFSNIVSVTPDNPFIDVKGDAYYYNALMWAYNSGVIAGTSDETFSPGNNCTRGQLAVMIYRMFGKPSISGMTIPFTDVKSSDYFYKAVVWAYNAGIISGTSGTKFSPSSSITRQDLVVMLWRMQNKPKVTATNPFTDVNEGMYSYKAIMWAYKLGVTSGTSSTTFSPKDQCTRGQIAAFLYKYNKMFHVI